MKAETVIKTRLSEVSGVTDLVGDRIYPGSLPQDEHRLSIVYKRLPGSRRLKGAHSDPGIAYVPIQVICVGAKEAPADSVLALGEQVRLALERYGNIWGGLLVGGVLLYDIQIGSDATDYDPDLDAHVFSIDFTVNHKE